MPMRRDRKPTASRPTLAGALVTAVAFSGGCSLLLHADASQCSTDDDCTTRGGAFAETTCNKTTGTCVPKSVMPPSEGGLEASADTGIDRTADMGVDSPRDVTVDQTMEAAVEGGDDSEAEAGLPDAPPDAPGCTTYTDCTPTSTQHPEVACDTNSGTCVQLTTDECPFVLPEYNTWSTTLTQPPLFLGAFATLPSSFKTDPSYLNYKLVINDFTNFGGIPAGPPAAPGKTGQVMPVVVICDNSANIHTAIAHLQTDLHVPGIITNLDSVALKTAFLNDLYPGGTFTINAFSANSSIVPPTLTTDGLLWHMLGQPGDSAPAYAAFFPRVESYVRGLQNLGSPSADAGSEAGDGGDGGDAGAAWTPLRVATVTGNATDTEDLAGAVMQVLQWNGQSKDANATAGLYLNVNIDSILTPGNTVNSIAAGSGFSSAVNALLNFRPNVVVSFASEEFVRLLEVLETRWSNTTDAGAPNPKPFYLIGPYNQISTELLSGFVGAGTAAPTEARRMRIAGIDVATTTDTTDYMNYVNHFLGVYPGQQADLGQENYYDAMYFLVYSVVAAGHVAPLGGANLAQSVQRLVAGTQYSMGPGSDMGNIVGALSAPQGKISLFGALGPPTFDLRTDARIGQGGVYCVARNTTSGAASYSYDVLRVTSTPADGGAGTLGGTFSCYPGL